MTLSGSEDLSLDGPSGSTDPFWTADGFEPSTLWDTSALWGETMAWKMLEAREGMRLLMRASGNPIPDWWEPKLGDWLDAVVDPAEEGGDMQGGAISYAWAYTSFFPHTEWWAARIGYEEGLDLEGDLDIEWPANQEGDIIYVLRHPITGARVREWAMPMEDIDGWAREAFLHWRIRAYWCREYLLYIHNTIQSA